MKQQSKTPRGYISRYDRFKVLKRQGWKCKECRVKLKYSSKQKFPGEVAHIDHIIPLSKGGEDNIGNYQALCPKCNLTKSASMPDRIRTGGMSHSELFNEIQKVELYLLYANEEKTEYNTKIIKHMDEYKNKLKLYTPETGRV